MIRRFNYTRRQRIDKRRVSIELHETDDGATLAFSAELDLADLSLPDDARLVIVAMRSLNAMRFDWGTVGHPAPPPDRRLNDALFNPSFRVIALDASQKILALANNITPRRVAGRESLLWLREDDLGQEVWRLDFSGDPGRPTLLINSNIRGISSAMRQDDALRGAVLPEALRAILTRALIVDGAAPFADDADDGWSEWLGFVDGFYTAEYPVSAADEQLDRNAVTAWIDGAVAAFTAERFHASALYAKARHDG